MVAAIRTLDRGDDKRDDIAASSKHFVALADVLAVMVSAVQ
jgi:hypothetical protein